MSQLPHRILFGLGALCASLIACEDPINPGDATGGNTATGGGTSTGGSGTTGGSGNQGTGGSGTAVTASVCGSGDMPFNVLADEPNNMTFSSTITLAEQQVPPNSVDITMDWTALTQDFLGHDLSFQGGMKAAVLVVWDVPITEVARMINEDDDTLNSHAFASLQFATDGTRTTAALTEFTSFGAVIDEATLLEYLDPANNYSYTLMAQAHPSTLGRDVQMIQAFSLTEAATSSTVTLTDTSTQLDWEANLDSLMPTPLPAAQASVLVDWFSSITTNSFGGDFVNNQITEVLIGQYDPSLDLNAEFLDIELNATELWRGQVTAGSNFNLQNATTEGGAAFTGVPAGSTDQWLLGLLCTTCVNPTPWYITRIQACP